MNARVVPKQNRGKSRQDYETPAEFIAAVQLRFGQFYYDLAATALNAKAPNFITQEQNSLAADWHGRLGHELGFLNPPFADLEPWVRKCSEECRRGARILALLPAGVGSNWFADHVFGRASVLFLRPRLCFDGKDPYPRDLMLAVYDRRFPAGLDCWRWRT